LRLEREEAGTSEFRVWSRPPFSLFLAKQDPGSSRFLKEEEEVRTKNQNRKQKIKEGCGGTTEIVHTEKGKVTVESWKHKLKRQMNAKKGGGGGFNNVNERNTIERRLQHVTTDSGTHTIYRSFFSKTMEIVIEKFLIFFAHTELEKAKTPLSFSVDKHLYTRTHREKKVCRRSPSGVVAQTSRQNKENKVDVIF